MIRDDITVRPLESVDEFHRAAEVQRAIWGMPTYRENVPVHVLITAQKNGGLVLGAFDGDEMVGYLFGFLGFTDAGDLKHCSHMMGVVPEYRGRGLSVALKQAQRSFVLGQGLDLVTWTYDPLEVVNAYLNLAKLGAVCRTYFRNLYGEIQDSLNQGMPTDRFEVEWWIRSERVTLRAQGAAPVERSLAELTTVNKVERGAQGLPRPVRWEFAEVPAVAVEAPSQFQQVKREDLVLARDWRFVTREIFEAYFAAGYTAVDVVRSREDDEFRWFYVLERSADMMDV